MATSTESFIDKLAAATTIVDDGDLCFVSIPGDSTLSESERTAVYNKAEQLRTANAVSDALVSRLECITPPLDDDEENEESRLLEAQARKDLEADGCPPCYPPDFEVPIPKTCQLPIIKYWNAFEAGGDVVLCAQLSDWRKFRAFQAKVRRYFRKKPFSEFVQQVRERRQRHGLNGDVFLLMDSKHQSHLENWVEYQNYRLHLLERLRDERVKLESELVDDQLKANDTDTAVAKRAVWDAQSVQCLLEYNERKLAGHKDLLQWTEQERQAMDAGYQTFVEENDDDQARDLGYSNAVEENDDDQNDSEQDIVLKAVRRTSTCARRTRRLKTSVVAGKARVSKGTTRKGNRQSKKPQASQPESATCHSDALTPSSIPQGPQQRATKRQTGKEDRALRPLRPQRVAKTRRSAHDGTISIPGTRQRGIRQSRSREWMGTKRRLELRRQQLARSLMTRARSGL